MTFKLVQSDTSSAIQSTITRMDTGEAVPLDGGEVVELKVRVRNATPVEFTLTGFGTPSELAAGIVTFSFGDNLIDLTPGYYEGEIQLTYVGGAIESVYEILIFQVREDF